MSGAEKGAGEKGVRFAGYAALFDRIDKGGDVIRPGAFAESLRHWAGRQVPLLWQHRPDAPVGSIEHVAEDGRGLRVIGRIAPGTAGTAGEAARALARGAVTGLSFGYRVLGAKGAEPRVLTGLELVEVSLVTFPMQPGARVHAVEGGVP